LLFDLGTRYDWWNLPPHIANTIEGHVPGYRVLEDPLDILKNGGIDLNNLEALVLSHLHFDHFGNPSALPKHVKLVVGPGFKDACMPGYPTNESSPFNDADFEGREVIETPFHGKITIGDFPAYDYFGDGSFYGTINPLNPTLQTKCCWRKQVAVHHADDKQY
jgi:glyoxylase-like metal-dependent hydrolase (beta-lactamase superfamily II)